jgi:predicted RNase H-like HicB family nuclease
LSAYTLVLEAGEHNWSAYFPEVPGCVATGANRDETIANATEALAFHLEGLREAGEPVPEPHSEAIEIVA